MQAYRSEIRNSPKEQTIKVYIKDASKLNMIKELLEENEFVRLVEIQQSMSRDRVGENITVFRNNNIDINALKTSIDLLLDQYL